MPIHKDVKKWTTAIAIASVGTLLIAGCSTGGGTNANALPTQLTEPTKPVEINYAGAAYAADEFQPVLDAFHKEHPNITVNYQSVPFADFNSTLATRLGNKDKTLDVFDVDMPRTDAYAARGWLSDLTPLFGNSLKGKIDPSSIESATVDSKVLAMPYQTSTNFMYYNKTLLNAAGVKLPGGNTADRLTWEQVTKDAKAAQTAGATYGLLFDQIDRYYQLEPLALSAGGGPGAKGAGNLNPTVNNDGWVKALSWYGSLFTDGISPRGFTANETPDIFKGGQLAYYVGGPWWASSFQENADLDFGVAPFPAFDGGDAATPTGGWSVGLNPASEKKNASLIFMQYMGLDNGGYAQYLKAVPVPPANIEGAAAYWKAAVFSDPRMSGAVDLMQDELAKTATLRLQTVGYVEFEDVIGKSFSDIINGAEAKSTLDGAQDQLTSAWAKYKK